VNTSAADMSARILGEKNDMTRSLRPAGHTTPRAPAPEAPCLRSHAHRQPGQQLHQSPAGLLSMTHSPHRPTTAESSLSGMGSLSTACHPVVTDDVQITVRSVRSQHYIYMLTREGWRMEEGVGFFAARDHVITCPGRQGG
jgi:hypothetical protein